MGKHSIYQWAVVGGGPAGISAVGALLDAGTASDKILWLDPYFAAGDFGRLWGDVSSNTSVDIFQRYFAACTAFQPALTAAKFEFNQLNPKDHCKLSQVATLLNNITKHFRQNIHSITGQVTTITINNGCWQLTANNKQTFHAEKIILATGAEPKTLNYPAVEKIDLCTALTYSKLAQSCHSSDTIAVFGSSHSAIIVIRHLIELGIKKIVNFYLSPLRFAVKYANGFIYDNTGLKGETAQWAHQNLSKQCLPPIHRYLSTPQHIEQWLPTCSKVVYATGFKQRKLTIDNINLADYDKTTGIIAPGLFGLGIGFPKLQQGLLGNAEYDVGLWKFMRHIKEVMPIWLEYGL